MTRASWRAVAEAVAMSARGHGLDLHHAAALSCLEADTLGHACSVADPLVLFVGNTRAMWPFIVANASADQPVDSWVEAGVERATEPIEHAFRTYFVHRRYDGAFLPFQRLAHAAGMLHLGPSHLSLHPEHGPWVALRALIVVDVPGPAVPPQSAPDPCAACAKPCLEAVEVALQAPEEAWRAWLEVRDVCPEGRPSRYGDAQIRYHYSKDPSALTS